MKKEINLLRKTMSILKKYGKRSMIVLVVVSIVFSYFNYDNLDKSYFSVNQNVVKAADTENEFNEEDAKNLLMIVTGLSESQIKSEWISLVMGYEVNDNKKETVLTDMYNTISKFNTRISFMSFGIDVKDFIEIGRSNDDFKFLLGKMGDVSLGAILISDVINGKFDEAGLKAAMRALSGAIPNGGMAIYAGQAFYDFMTYIADYANKITIGEYINNYCRFREAEFSSSEAVEQTESNFIYPLNLKLGKNGNYHDVYIEYMSKLRKLAELYYNLKYANIYTINEIANSSNYDGIHVDIESDEENTTQYSPFNMKFDANVVGISEGSSVEYSWFINNNILSNQKTCFYNFEKPGQYQVVIKVKETLTDGTVKNTRASKIIEAKKGVVANFTSFPKASAPGNKIKFDASLSEPASKITKYTWDFGDGTLKDTYEPVAYHQYEKANTLGMPYKVKLKVYTSSGFVDEEQKSIYIGDFGPTTIYDTIPDKYYEFNSAFDPYVSDNEVTIGSNTAIDITEDAQINFTKGLNILGDVNVYGENIKLNSPWLKLAGSMTLDKGSNFTVNDLTLDEYSILNLNGGTLIVNGNLYMNNNRGVILNQGTLIINGNLYMQRGGIDFNQGTLIVKGDMEQRGGTVDIGNGKLTVDGHYSIAGRYMDENGDISYVYSNGILKMTDDKGYVKVGGDFATFSTEDHGEHISSGVFEGCLTAGTLEVKGDFNQGYRGYNFQTNGTHKVILSGNKLQTVKFEYPDYSWFNILEIKNTSNEGIKFDNRVLVKGKLKESPIPAPIQNGKNLCLSENAVVEGGVWSNDIGIYYKWEGMNNIIFKKDVYVHERGEGVNLGNSSLVVHGNMYMGYESEYREWMQPFSLNQGTLTIKGDLEHRAGILDIGSGKLTVDGDYRIASGKTIKEDGDVSYGQSRGILKMTDDKGYVKVGGDFATFSTEDHGEHISSGVFEGCLTAGTLEVKGDFNQGYRGDNFATSGTHKVILSGNKLQTVKFDWPDYSWFNILEIKNTSSEGIKFDTRVVVTKLFDHHRNAFTVSVPSQFPDFDEDGIRDDIDEYPTVVQAPFGDINKDGKVTNEDSNLLKELLLGNNKSSLTEEQLKAADVDEDGKITSTDYSIIKRMISGKVSR